jgi:hypothetical protein
MDFTDYLWAKLIVFGTLAFLINFVYRLVTGRSLEADRRDREAAEQAAQIKGAKEH